MPIVLLAYLGFVVLGLPGPALGVAWPSVQHELGLAEAALGVVLAGSGVGYFAAGLVTGVAMRRWGTGTLMAASAATTALGLAVSALAPGLAVLALGALLAGLGSGTVDAGLNGVAALRFTPRQVNWLHGWFSLGTTLGPLGLTAVLVAGASWRVGYGGLAAVSLAMAALFRATRSGWPDPAPGTAPVAAGGSSAWRAAARHPLVWLQATLFFCDAGIELTLGQWSFTLLTERHGLGVATAGLGTGLYWASMTIGRFAIGLLVHRIGPDRLVRIVMTGALAGTMLVALGSAPLCLAGLVLAGLSLAPIFPTLIARVPARIGPGLALDAVGFNVSLAMVGTDALPALAGVLAGRLGLAAIGWLAVGAAALLLLLHELLLARAPGRAGSPVIGTSTGS